MKTRRGIIYVVTNDIMPGLIKIGVTSDLNARLKSLYNSSVPHPFDCYYAAEVNDVMWVEDYLHKLFLDDRVSMHREFFTTDPEKVVRVINDIQKSANEVSDDDIINIEKSKNTRLERIAVKDLIKVMHIHHIDDDDYPLFDYCGSGIASEFLLTYVEDVIKNRILDNAKDVIHHTYYKMLEKASIRLYGDTLKTCIPDDVIHNASDIVHSMMVCGYKEHLMNELANVCEMDGDNIEPIWCMDAYEFKRWAVEDILGGELIEYGTDIIDGTVLRGLPIMVRRSYDVGPKAIQMFAKSISAITDSRRVGYIVAFGFTKTACKEIDKIRKHDDIHIAINTVSGILNNDSTFNTRSITGRTHAGMQGSLF